ncbi:SRPBCC family protein [Nocardia vaccinii]|uniref:SRPBCC family protein n=1 Tax=Nocardia vaccinii TaxID=1822 RepID=UPI00082A20CA|nr:SRPBCC family protein [Nocardia vaccinii]
MRDAVSLTMSAPPDRVWKLISDVTQIGRFSPETFEAEWLDGATGPAVGVRFRGHVRRNEIGPVYWTVCRIVSCEPGREFAFVVLGPGGRALNTWRYRLTPTAEVTTVTESFELDGMLLLRIYWRLLGWARGRRNRRGMLETLQRVKRAAEQTA